MYSAVFFCTYSALYLWYFIFFLFSMFGTIMAVYPPQHSGEVRALNKGSNQLPDRDTVPKKCKYSKVK